MSPPAPDSNASSTVLLSSKHAAHESDLLPIPKAVLHPGPNGTGLKGEHRKRVDLTGRTCISPCIPTTALYSHHCLGLLAAPSQPRDAHLHHAS